MICAAPSSHNTKGETGRGSGVRADGANTGHFRCFNPVESLAPHPWFLFAWPHAPLNGGNVRATDRPRHRGSYGSILRQMHRNLPEGESDCGFVLEADLVSAFVAAARSPRTPWRITGLITEFSYDHGRPDIILVDAEGHVVAFEAKLQKWRAALHQAYRNTTLAHLSYVVVPARVAICATRHSREFADRGVGLCSVDRGEVVIHCVPQLQQPLQPWLSDRAAAAVAAAAVR